MASADQPETAYRRHTGPECDWLHNLNIALPSQYNSNLLNFLDLPLLCCLAAQRGIAIRALTPVAIQLGDIARCGAEERCIKVRVESLHEDIPVVAQAH